MDGIVEGVHDGGHHVQGEYLGRWRPRDVTPLRRRLHDHQSVSTSRECTEAVSRRSRRRYKTKLAEIEHKEASILLGLEKLEQGAKDVEDMKVVLAEIIFKNIV